VYYPRIDPSDARPPMIGRTLSHYRLLDELGRGGMGIVYRAVDLTLDREVAFKVLLPECVADPERRRRFLQEAKAAAKLQHPHIGVVYEVDEAEGVTFIAMELIRGERLREELARSPLDASRALGLALEIAEGLAKAHDTGIVHRDLTPGNVIVTDDGHAKIIDFGLAKLIEPTSGEAGETETRPRTETGLVIGTTAYMSPEQARGRPADHRSDIFSLGVVLYEMLSGGSPFKRQSSAETLNALINTPHAPVPLPFEGDAATEVRRIVHKCLAKDPRDRYQTMKDLVVDLRGAHRRLVAGTLGSGSTVAAGTPRRRWIPVAIGALALALLFVAGYAWFGRRGPALTSSAADATRKRIAVLPFQNLGAADDEYFASGVTDEIMTRLSAVSRLAVISRNSVLQYAGSTKTSRQIGTELNVDYLVQGTVQWQPATDGPGRVRVTPQLVRVADEEDLWSETYERQFDEIFKVQSDIASRVIEELNITVLALERTIMEGRPTGNLDAYREYLRGHFLWYHDAKLRSTALAHFERATALDPDFAMAHAAVANVASDIFFYKEPTPTWEQKADASIAKALALNPNLAEAYLARGNLLWSQPHGFPHDVALREIRRALTLNPSLAEGRVALGRIYEHIGLLDEARDQFTQASALDPANREARGRVWTTYFWQHDYARALAEIGRSDATGWNYVQLLTYAGQEDEARRRVDELLKGPWIPSFASSFHIVRVARGGHRARVDAALPALEALARNPQELSHVHHAQYWLALAHAVLGRKRDAMTWLRMSAAQGFPCYPFFAKDPNLANLQGDPEFEAFMNDLKAQWERLKAEAAAR
jgi:serine/threonine protein kinase/tetratricopeptide (TPR) repeat protein